MDSKLLNKINQENAQVIFSKISEDAQEEIRVILDAARKESDKILSQARKVVEGKNQVIFQDAEREIQKSREKAMSSLHLEKKRLVLGEKDKFIQAVLAQVIKTSQDFRKENGYPEFLKNAIIEGVEVIGENNIEIYYSGLDERFFSQDFKDKIEKACANALKNECGLKFKEADFIDLGVIVNSIDGRITYDNRFLARLGRVKEDIYFDLLKESF
jgi:vacuolar-type H+-ATPase subunit E/Vma4